MPRNMTLRFGSTDHTVPVATEEELLEFANKVRAAGGAEIIAALLPSTKRSPYTCVIANALNFSCAVQTYFATSSDALDDQPWQWIMAMPINMKEETIQAVADSVGLERVGGGRLLLPEHIGNAARAFDQGLAFQDLAEE